MHTFYTRFFCFCKGHLCFGLFLSNTRHTDNSHSASSVATILHPPLFWPFISILIEVNSRVIIPLSQITRVEIHYVWTRKKSYIVIALLTAHQFLINLIHTTSIYFLVHAYHFHNAHGSYTPDFACSG